MITGAVVFWIITKGFYIAEIISNLLYVVMMILCIRLIFDFYRIPSIWAFIVIRIQLYGCQYIFTKRNEDQVERLDNA